MGTDHQVARWTACRIEVAEFTRPLHNHERSCTVTKGQTPEILTLLRLLPFAKHRQNGWPPA